MITYTKESKLNDNIYVIKGVDFYHNGKEYKGIFKILYKPEWVEEMDLDFWILDDETLDNIFESFVLNDGEDFAEGFSWYRKGEREIIDLSHVMNEFVMSLDLEWIEL